MGLWHSRDSSTDSYERVLSDIDTKIRKGYVRLSDLRLRESRTRTGVLWYLTAAYIAATLALLSWTKRHIDSFEYITYNAVKWGSIGGGPIVIYYLLVLVSWYYRRLVASTEQELENLKAKQKDKVEELKEMTKFYKAKELIDRYENVLYKEPDPTASNAGSKTSLNSRGVSMPSLVPATTTDGQMHTQLQHGSNSMPDLQQQQQHPQMMLSQPLVETQTAQSTASINWLDKVLDKIVGEDESNVPYNKYALICAQCHAHNGLALPDEFPNVRYYCPHCKFFNEARSILRGEVPPPMLDESRMLPPPPHPGLAHSPAAPSESDMPRQRTMSTSSVRSHHSHHSHHSHAPSHPRSRSNSTHSEGSLAHGHHFVLPDNVPPLPDSPMRTPTPHQMPASDEDDTANSDDGKASAVTSARSQGSDRQLRSRKTHEKTDVELKHPPQDSSQPYVPTKCNGYRELLDRRYSDVSYAVTHNSYAVGSCLNLSANQRTSITEQLRRGIRGINFYVVPHCCWFCDVAALLGHPQKHCKCRKKLIQEAQRSNSAPGTSSAVASSSADHPTGAATAAQPANDDSEDTSKLPADALYMCHTNCALQNSGPLRNGLAEIRAFLDKPENRDEVVTVQVGNNFGATRKQLAVLAEESGLMPYLHPHAAGEPFPLLGDMVASNKRVFFFASDIESADTTQQPGQEQVILDYFSFISETPWQLRTEKDWTCALDRPAGVQRELLLLNHWLYFTIFGVDIPSERQAKKVNRTDIMLQHVQKCERLRNHRVNFVKIDYYETSNVLQVLAEMNGVPAPH
ncbi:hypothetical protein RI367_000654 [Sorochytrium milnesiophthora]